MRLINADELKKAIQDNGYSHYYEIFKIIDDAPEVSIDKELAKEARAIADENFQYGYKKGREDAAEARPTGYWASYQSDDYSGGGCVVCSNCNWHYSWGAYFEVETFKYCPNCGAIMSGGRDNGDA